MSTATPEEPAVRADAEPIARINAKLPKLAARFLDRLDGDLIARRSASGHARWLAVQGAIDTVQLHRDRISEMSRAELEHEATNLIGQTPYDVLLAYVPVLIKWAEPCMRRDEWDKPLHLRIADGFRGAGA